MKPVLWALWAAGVVVLLAAWWRASKPAAGAAPAGDAVWDDDVDAGAE